MLFSTRILPLTTALFRSYIIIVTRILQVVESTAQDDEAVGPRLQLELRNPPRIQVILDPLEQVLHEALAVLILAVVPDERQLLDGFDAHRQLKPHPFRLARPRLPMGNLALQRLPPMSEVIGINQRFAVQVDRGIQLALGQGNLLLPFDLRVQSTAARLRPHVHRQGKLLELLRRVHVEGHQMKQPAEILM